MLMDRKIQYCQGLCSSQLINIFDAMSVKFLASYFMDNDKLILKFR